MKTYKQGDLLWPREHIKLGRISASPGQSFWVTSSQLSQENSGSVSIARSGRNSGHAVSISLQDAERFFHIADTRL